MTEPRRCPVHDIPDCSPLLNGCTRLTEPAASTGNWWHNAVEQGVYALFGGVYGGLNPADAKNAELQVERTLAAALPLFVAEATRRIEAERDENATYNYGLETALAVVAGLAGEVGQQ